LHKINCIVFSLRGKGCLYDYSVCLDGSNSLYETTTLDELPEKIKAELGCRELVYPSCVDKTAYIYYNMHTDLSREVFMNKKDEKIKL